MDPNPSFVYGLFLCFLVYSESVNKEAKKMKQEIIKRLTTQVVDKLEVACLYLEFSNFFNSNGKNKYEAYYKEQAKEEINKAMYIYDYLRDKKVNKESILMHRPINYKNVEEVLNSNLNTNIKLSKLFTKLQELSIDIDDASLTRLLQDFETKQSKDRINTYKIISLSKLFSSYLNYERMKTI